MNLTVVRFAPHAWDLSHWLRGVLQKIEIKFGVFSGVICLVTKRLEILLLMTAVHKSFLLSLILKFELEQQL